jgi:integrase
MRRLFEGPMLLSCRQIAALRVSDFTDDSGENYVPHVVAGNRVIPLDRDFVMLLDRYLFRHGRCGTPFLDWRPDIPPYVFQSTKRYCEDRPLSRSSVYKIVSSLRPAAADDPPGP